MVLGEVDGVNWVGYGDIIHSALRYGQTLFGWGSPGQVVAPAFRPAVLVGSYDDVSGPSFLC